MITCDWSSDVCSSDLYVDRLQAPRAPRNPPDHFARVEETLRELARAGGVSCVRGRETVWAIGPDQHLVAAFYRNTIAHLLFTRAIAELVAGKVGTEEAPDALQQGQAEALRLRDLLKFEFFFPAKKEFAQELAAELRLVDPDWEQRALEREDVWTRLQAARPHLAHRVLQSFLEAYEVVAERLAARDPGEPVDEKDFLRECLGVGRQWRMQGRLHSTESISKELFSNGLKLAANRGLLDPEADALAARRRAFADEIGGVVARLARIRELAIAEAGQPA
jgi:glycerol-3-phosphate O-acyltransferase